MVLKKFHFFTNTLKFKTNKNSGLSKKLLISHNIKNLKTFNKNKNKNNRQTQKISENNMQHRLSKILLIFKNTMKINLNY